MTMRGPRYETLELRNSEQLAPDGAIVERLSDGSIRVTAPDPPHWQTRAALPRARLLPVPAAKAAQMRAAQAARANRTGATLPQDPDIALNALLLRYRQLALLLLTGG
jgi:hypothetical protein